MLVVLEVRMVALHAAETMVAMTVIVNVTSVGGGWWGVVCARSRMGF